MRDGIEQTVTAVLQSLNAQGAYLRSLVCTEDGLLVAHASGVDTGGEDLAAFTSLFDTVVERATRDLGVRGVDEVTLLDATRHRLIIRPLSLTGRPRFFLVVRAERNATWRRNTNRACAALAPLLQPLVQEAPHVDVL